MSKYFCNPINISYTYQFNQAKDKCTLNREAADPSMILFKGKYYLFPSMNLGFYVSENLVDWEYHPYPKLLSAYDYAPDVRQIGEWMYFSASRRGVVCDFYRTKDPLADEFERIEGNFDFWDPNLFCDDDGRVYFYYGCSNATPIWGDCRRHMMCRACFTPAAALDFLAESAYADACCPGNPKDTSVADLKELFRKLM